MATRSSLLEQVVLRGLELAPSQVFGAVRLVPVLRREIREDLRLTKRSYNEDVTLVALDGELLGAGTKYLSYVPHALVMSWSDDGMPVAAFGTQLVTRDGKRLGKVTRLRSCGPTSPQVSFRQKKQSSCFCCWLACSCCRCVRQVIRCFCKVFYNLSIEIS